MNNKTIKERPILFSGPMVRAILEGRKTQTRRVIKTQPPEYDSIKRSGEEWKGPCLGITDYTEAYGRTDGPWWVYGRPWGGSPRLNLPAPKCPFGEVGDRLWVRETHYLNGLFVKEGMGRVRYAADDVVRDANGNFSPAVSYEPRWRPSIHMPRWACRILLEVVSVRVERLQGISAGDAISEGVMTLRSAEWDRRHFPEYREVLEKTPDGEKPPLGPNPVECFRALWESIHGRPKLPANPRKRRYGRVKKALEKIDVSWNANPWVWVVEFKRVDGASENLNEAEGRKKGR